MTSQLHINKRHPSKTVVVGKEEKREIDFEDNNNYEIAVLTSKTAILHNTMLAYNFENGSLIC